MVMPNVPATPDSASVIHALLKPRWRWDADQQSFATATRRCAASETLPRGSEVGYLVPRLQKLKAEAMQAQQKKLARWLQIKLPASSNSSDVLKCILKTAWAAEAHLAPTPSPPGSISPPT